MRDKRIGPIRPSIRTTAKIFAGLAGWTSFLTHSRKWQMKGKLIRLAILRHASRRALICAFALLIMQSVRIEAQSPRQTDTSPTFGVAFRPAEIKRQKLTQTEVQITLQARSAIPELDVTVAGITNDLQQTEATTEPYRQSMSQVQKGQKPQLTKTITSVDGYSGELDIMARMVNPGFGVTESRTVMPYETKGGQFKLSATKGSQGGAIGVSAKPTKYTVTDGYVVKGAVGVSLKGVSKLQEQSISVTVTAEGVTLLDRDKSTPSSAQQFWQSITFAAADGQRGRITTQVSGKTEAGKDYARRSYLYVLADPNQLFTSTSGFVDLDIQKLKADRAANRIDDTQYTAGLTAILSGSTEASGVKP
jgi:hypothetical protein